MQTAANNQLCNFPSQPEKTVLRLKVTFMQQLRFKWKSVRSAGMTKVANSKTKANLIIQTHHIDNKIAFGLKNLPLIHLQAPVLR